VPSRHLAMIRTTMLVPIAGVGRLQGNFRHWAPASIPPQSSCRHNHHVYCAVIVGEAREWGTGAGMAKGWPRTVLVDVVCTAVYGRGPPHRSLSSIRSHLNEQERGGVVDPDVPKLPRERGQLAQLTRRCRHRGCRTFSRAGSRDGSRRRCVRSRSGLPF